MKHYDYDWYLTANRIVLDSELNTDKIGWKHGDIFRFVNIDGQQQLIKVDPIEKFLYDGVTNGTN